MDLPTVVPRTSPAATGWVPVTSCTLPTAERPLRAAELDDLFAASLRAVDHPSASPTQARLVLAGDETLGARVQRLVDAETACCSFVAFTVTPLEGPGAVSGETVVLLDIGVPATHSPVLAALARRAEQVRQEAS